MRRTKRKLKRSAGQAPATPVGETEAHARWLRLVQTLIQRYSTPPRKKGKFRGHGSTDVVAWLTALARESRRSLRITATSPFDENMAIALHVGHVLLSWWACCQRAKTYDPNRPLDVRRRSNALLNHRLAGVIASMSDDELMGAVFGDAQHWNFPFGRGAFGGSFI